MARQRKAQDHTKDAIAQDQEAIAFVRLNAPYLTATAIQNALHIYPEKLTAIAAAAGVDMSKEAKEPRAEDIARHHRFLPIGTVIEKREHWTLIHLESNIPGITGVTRHYAIDDE